MSTAAQHFATMWVAVGITMLILPPPPRDISAVAWWFMVSVLAVTVTMVQSA